jgi:hypothetical protein
VLRLLRCCVVFCCCCSFDVPAGNWVVNDEVIMPLDKAPIHLAVEAGAADIVQQLLAAGGATILLGCCCCLVLLVVSGRLCD